MTEIAERLEATSAPAPTFVGQATAIEQSRAIAEVQAMCVIAQNCPRNIQAAVTAMRETCAQKGLADRAFFKFPRGGATVSGPSVHLARELARIWGHVNYGISELRRDDEKGESEMLAYAWDCQSNTRNAQIFIVPHKRDKKGGPEKLVDLRDIYESNANQGARRVRESIFAILPPWFVDEAKSICTQTIETDGGSGKPLPTRIADAVSAFEGIGVTQDQLEQKVGRPSAKWTAHDVAQLGITFQSLQRGEVTIGEEFETARVTSAEILGNANGDGSATKTTPPTPSVADQPSETCPACTGPMHQPSECPVATAADRQESLA